MVNRVVCLIQVEADLFKHSLRVRAEDRMLATIDEVVIQVLLISYGKIARQH